MFRSSIIQTFKVSFSVLSDSGWCLNSTIQELCNTCFAFDVGQTLPNHAMVGSVAPEYCLTVSGLPSERIHLTVFCKTQTLS